MMTATIRLNNDNNNNYSNKSCQNSDKPNQHGPSVSKAAVISVHHCH